MSKYEWCARGERPIVVGRTAGAYGLQGWVKIVSGTNPIESLLRYSSWLLQDGSYWDEMGVSSGRIQGNKLVAKLDGIEDPDQARHVTNRNIAVPRHWFPPTDSGEHYWCDLIGFKVINRYHDYLGKVTEIIGSAANDVLVVQGVERLLIPWVRDVYVIEVQTDRSRIVVDWDVAV